MTERAQADLLDAALRQAGPLGTVLHIGAGYGLDLHAYLAAGARQVVLVEPEPVCRPHLAALASAHAAVQVVEAAAVPAAGKDETGRLYRFSYSGLNSLHPGAELESLFPGLQRLEPLQVALRSITELSELPELEQPGPHALVIEACGQALTLLQALQAADRLERFRLIRVRESRRPVYGVDATISEVRAFLQEQGFDRDPMSGGVDPEFPVFSVRAGKTLSAQVSIRRYRQLEAQLAEAKAIQTALDSKQAENSALQEQLANVRTGAEELRGKLSEATRDLNAALTQVAELSATQEELAKARAEAEELRGKLTEAARARNAAQAQVAELTEAQEALTKAQAEAEELRGKLSEATRDLNAAQTQVAELSATQEELAKARAEAEELRGKLTEAARARNAAQAQVAELSALQEELTNVRAEAEELRGELTEAARARNKAQKDWEHLTRERDRLGEEVERLSARDRRVREELMRTHGQVDLIRDLLLQGQGL